MPNYISILDASRHLKTAKRVTVVGTSAGGKSTLSAKIEARLGLPHVPYDRDVCWLPGWQLRDKAERADLMAKLTAQKRWVMDGTHISSFPTRLPRSDLLVWMRPHRLQAMWQLSRRVLRNYGQVRPDMAEGCPEQLPDRAFLSYIWNFERDQSPRIIAGIDRFGADVPVCVLRGNRDSARLLAGLE